MHSTMSTSRSLAHHLPGVARVCIASGATTTGVPDQLTRMKRAGSPPFLVECWIGVAPASREEAATWRSSGALDHQGCTSSQPPASGPGRAATPTISVPIGSSGRIAPASLPWMMRSPAPSRVATWSRGGAKSATDRRGDGGAPARQVVRHRGWSNHLLAAVVAGRNCGARMRTIRRVSSSVRQPIRSRTCRQYNTQR